MIPLVELAATLAKAGAPAIAKALGGSAAGPVIQSVANAIGSAPTAAAIHDKIAESPEAIEKILAIDTQLAALQTADVQDARAKSMSNEWTGRLAMTLTIMFGFYASALLFVKIPPENKDAVMICLGVLGTGGAGLSWAYYFGSSLGARRWQRIVAEDQRKN